MKTRPKRVFSLTSESNLQWSLMTTVNVVFVAAAMCNCSHAPTKSSTLSPSPSPSSRPSHSPINDSYSSYLITSSPSPSLSDVLPQSWLPSSVPDINNRDNNNKLNSVEDNFRRRKILPKVRPLVSNATMTILTKFSTRKQRVTRQTPVSSTSPATHEPNELCQADSDCQRLAATETPIGHDAHSRPQQTLNDSLSSILPFICIDGTCRSNDKYQNANSTDNLTFTSTSDPQSERLKMLPIMIVLGVMFVGICVAMNLFSRARFKNHRSGIFANPRILKVANAQNSQGGGKRRRSKQVSARRSRTELLARAQQMSEQLQRQQQLQLQMELDNQVDDGNEAEMNLDMENGIAGSYRNDNQMTTCVQIENSLPSGGIETITDGKVTTT